MGYALQQKDAQTAPVQTPVDDAPQKTTPPPQDVVPEENKAAAGGDKDKDDAAKAEAEKKRAAEVTATWQGLLGKWLGGQLAPLVLEHVSVDALNGYVQEQQPWALAKDPAQQGRLATVLATATEGLRALAELLHPVTPLATAKLWEALGAEGALGRLEDQPIREAGRWGRLPAGTPQQALAVLFPRIEAQAEAEAASK